MKKLKAQKENQTSMINPNSPKNKILKDVINK
jgi:hypothetical protein